MPQELQRAVLDAKPKRPLAHQAKICPGLIPQNILIVFCIDPETGHSTFHRGLLHPGKAMVAPVREDPDGFSPLLHLLKEIMVKPLFSNYLRLIT